MELEQKIEGLLFFKGEPMEIAEIARLLKEPQDQVGEAISKLADSLSNRGVSLIKKESSVMIGTNKELSELIESIRKEEITKDLSKATLETFSIILYKNGSTRGEIDFIRGVNSSFIIRNLLVRGLVERQQDPKDSRRIIYKPTFDALSFMGITSIKELPGYEEVQKQLEETLNQNTHE